MKFIAIHSNIKNAISIVERAAGENENLPILKNILIDAKDGVVIFSATNLEIAIAHKVTGKVLEEGKMTVPISLLSSIISNIQSDRLNFEKKGNDLEITTDSYQAIVRGMAADDFPIMPQIANKDNFLEIKGTLFKEAVQQIAVASQFSDLRPELNSILFDFSLEKVVLAATDGFRLTEKTLPSSFFTTKIAEPFRALIPLKTSQEIARIVKDDENIRLFFDENQILLKTDGSELISRLVEGNFPDYSAIIPHEFDAEIAVNKDELANALKLAGVFGQKTSEISIRVHENKKAIEVISSDQALGENTHTLPAKVKGEVGEIFFNWRYLLDPLKVIKTQDVFMGVQENANPALIRSTTDTSYYYILKPILRA